MSYTIGLVIWGVAEESIIEAVQDSDELEKLGFEPTYEGLVSHWFGVKLGEIDETAHVDLERVPQPTADHKSKFMQMLAKLPEDLLDVMPSPKWQIVWTHS